MDFTKTASDLLNLVPQNMPVTFVCVGTDRSTGDALGPLVGTELEKLGYNVIGTIDEPCHAVNLHERIADIPKGHHFVIAIDACLGQISSVGRIDVLNHPLKPGIGVNKDLGEVGDICISGIVNVGGFMEYFVLQNTRLSTVMRMAKQIVEAIQIAVPKRHRRVLTKSGLEISDGAEFIKSV